MDRPILVEIVRHRFPRCLAVTTIEVGRAGQFNHRSTQGFPILFLGEITVNVLSYCLRDSAVTSCDYRQTSGHGFENRIWDALLVFISRRLTRMNKEMRPMIEPAQILLAEKAAKVNPVGNAETLSQGLQLRLEWAFARNHEFRLWKLDGKRGKSPNGRRHAFLI